MQICWNRWFFWLAFSISNKFFDCHKFPSKNNIHNFMDENELRYYFGTDSLQVLPEYEIVDLPENLWNVRENIISDDFGGSIGEKNVSFEVFKR